METEIKTTRQRMIKDVLDDMRDTELLYIHRQYCEKCNCMDDEIYDMDMFDEIMDGNSPTEIARRICYGDGFNPSDNYFRFDGHANLESFDYVSDKIYTDEIADYIDDNETDFGDEAIKEILREYDQDGNLYSELEDEDEDEDDEDSDDV